MPDRSTDLEPDTYDQHPDATTVDIYGPGRQGARDGYAPRMAPQQRRERLRMFDDPHADYLLPDGRCRDCGAQYRHVDTCPRVPGNPPAPALYDTVSVRVPALDSIDIGLVVGQPHIAPGVFEVAVEWEHGVTLEAVADLLTDIGACDHGREAGRCGEPTAPGFERCEQHGGADPLPVPR